MISENATEHRHLTEGELSKRWSVSVSTLRRWRQQGTGPAYMKLGKRVAYSLDAIEKYERENTIKQ